MPLPDEVHVDNADGLVSLQVREKVARMSARGARATAAEMIAHADEVDPPVRAMQTEPGAP